MAKGTATDDQVIVFLGDVDHLTKEHNLTTAEIARRIGMTRDFIERQQAGEARPSSRTCEGVKALREMMDGGTAPPAPEPKVEKRATHVRSGTTPELVARAKSYFSKGCAVLAVAERQATGIWKPGIQAVREKAEAVLSDLAE